MKTLARRIKLNITNRHLRKMKRVLSKEIELTRKIFEEAGGANIERAKRCKL